MCEHDWAFLGGLDRPDPRSVRLDCENPQVLACRACGDTVLCRCGTARDSKCSPCSQRYRGRVGRVAGSGLVVSAERGFFVTLTAPGHVPHRLPSGALCPCTPVAVRASDRRAHMAEWNGQASLSARRFLQDVRRLFPRREFPEMWEQVETADGGLRWRQKLDYFRAAEVQRRGALHYHFLIRGPLVLRVGKIRHLAIKHGFGHSVDVQRLQDGHASYVAKYVSKAADSRQDVPWRGWRLLQRVDQSTGEVVRVPRRSWRATYRTWSASRRWGESMASVKAAQSHYLLVMDQLVGWGEGASLGPSWAERAPRRPDQRAVDAALSSA